MKKYKYFLSLVLSSILVCISLPYKIAAQSIAPDQNTMIMTVNGTVDSQNMGTTLIHEHVLVDWIGADSTGYHRWDREKVIEKVLPYFEAAKEKGVDTILECTPAYLGRDPFILEELSRKSGIRILTNTGYYGAVDNRFMPEHARRESADEIAGRWMDEFNEGIDNSVVRPGFIKISVAADQPLSELHQKIVRAAALTHLETGLTIVSHTGSDEPAIEQINLLKEAGVSPSAWVWTHAQSGSLEANIRVAREGSWISLDSVNHDPDREPGDRGSIEWFVNRITELKNAGFLNRVLISHDAGYYNPDEPNGGSFRGYTDIFDHLIPELLDNNFTDDDIHQLLVINPREAYGIHVRKI
jgi:phosphotriesterase-related protein